MILTEITEKIRNDKDLGRGTCSHIDECFSDTELQELIGETINEIRGSGRQPKYKSIREVLYDKEVLWWEVEGITWPSSIRR